MCLRRASFLIFLKMEKDFLGALDQWLIVYYNLLIFFLFLPLSNVKSYLKDPCLIGGYSPNGGPHLALQ